MKDVLRTADEIPVSLVIAVAYGTLAVLANVFAEPRELSQRLAELGWLTPASVPAGEPWRLITYAFLHGGPLHLVFNLMMLFGVGPALERSLSSARFLALYVVSAIGGALLVALTNEPGQPVVGGSGALFGLMGAAVALNMRAGRHAFAFLDFEGPRRLLAMIAANLALGLVVPFVSNAGHLGGLVAGFAVTLLWLDRAAERSALRTVWRATALALLAGAAFASWRPVTRYDWLLAEYERADAAAKPRLYDALLLALPARLLVEEPEPALPPAGK